MELTEEEWEALVIEDLDSLERPDYGYKEEETLWSEVLPRLWQGGTGGGEDLEYVKYLDNRQQVTHRDFDTVITLYASAMPADWFVKEIRFGIYDADMSDFSPGQLFDLVRVAHEDWKRGKRVLIRCQAGWNRSGLVMALVLMRDGYTAGEAIDLIREKRSPHALCNEDFEIFLLAESPQKWQGKNYG